MAIKSYMKTLVAATGLFAICQAAGASQILYDSVSFVSGQQSVVDTFSVHSAGTLTVTLTDFAWPTPVSNLDMVVGNAQGLFGPESGAGTATFQIKGAETLYAQWFGDAQGPLGVGLVGLEIQFTPAGTTVPLPASLGLLLSGLAFLAWQRRANPPQAR